MRDVRLRRAAGVILWHLERTGDDEEAIARAQEREPELSGSEIAHALRWARAAQRVAELAQVASDDTTLAELFDRAELPWRDEEEV